MSAQMIIQALNNMTKLHRSMVALAKQKTEIIKKGDINSLQNLLKEENKHIQAIQRLEMGLKNETTLFLQKNRIEMEQPSLSAAIEIANELEKEALLQGKQELENNIKELSIQNQLNQQLLEQSLQFVNISLDLLQPDIDSYNYDRSENGAQENRQQSRSLFDSKA
ncbi:flagellar protein FlgN [Robertmurraya andreesenii]|uniref:Flagellar biosynthesis/type III secretory pathway chaperone n=1 Tax=Anoxybacillus andreesenii TaxID=1325932 RepID=A0ABT9V7J1_9BACL|nr:flagellar protein FlgN [Robertmurraya andreesenii]MDQ0156924.1 flagellar biosynthesis/type III secretory pathway chaperone [Robertmurraya andreesenii]